MRIESNRLQSLKLAQTATVINCLPMFFCDKTFPSPAMNLAFDEALLLADSGTLPAQDSPSFLRFWEADNPMVVLGRSSRVKEEVNTDLCQQRGIPVLRRVSGGATIVSGPGCLMYAVVLNTKQRSEILNVDSAHQFVLGHMVEALRQVDPSVQIAGTSDLVVKTPKTLIKFSGNSVRMVRSRILYHGTLLYDFDLPTISALLWTPPRQPDYRQQRSHQEFVGNLHAKRDELITNIQTVWSLTTGELEPISELNMNRLTNQAKNLVDQKYNTDELEFLSLTKSVLEALSMHRQSIIHLIKQYVAKQPEQSTVADRILDLVNQHEDCFERTCAPGHITGSAWVVSHDWQMHLLLHHRKLNKWLQPGGHADGQTNVAEVALREATEESGLTDLQVVTTLDPAGLMDLDVHNIPARYSSEGTLIDPEHEHHDLRFLIQCKTDQAPIVSEESNEVRWFTDSEIRSMTDEQSVLRLLEKANQFRHQWSTLSQGALVNWRLSLPWRAC